MPVMVLTAVTVAIVMLAAMVAWLPLGGVAHVTDEVAYTLQSRLLAAGMRQGPPGDHPSMLLFPFWNTVGGSYAVFPVGWPGLLAIGERLGVPWLVTPVLAGVLPWLGWRIARPWLSARGALLAALALALSPGVLILAGSRMAHTSVLVALALAFVQVRDRSHRRWAPIAGAAVAYTVLARPFDAVLVGVPLLIWGVWAASPGARAALVLLPGLAAGLVLADNAALTGSLTSFPASVWFDGWVADLGRPPGCNRLGFGPDVGCAPVLGTWGHTPAKALQIGLDTAARLDRLLLGVPGGGLVLLVGLWALRRDRRFLTALGVLGALVVGGHALYWSPGLAYGARFWHPLYILLPVMVGAAADRLPGKWAWVGLAGLSLAGGSALYAELAEDYWCTSPALERLLDDRSVDEGVLFVRSTGTAPTRSWPRLGVDSLTCDPMLASGTALQLLDPTRTTGGLQPRHALPDAESTRAYMATLPVGTRAWLADHRLDTGAWTLTALTP